MQKGDDENWGFPKEEVNTVPREGTEVEENGAGRSDPHLFSKMLSIVLHPNTAVLERTKKLVSLKNPNLDEISTSILQDPVLTLEILKTANAPLHLQNQPPITSPKAALVRLGAKIVMELLQELGSRHHGLDERSLHWFERYRGQCQRAGMLASMLTEIIYKPLREESSLVALYSYFGEMLAVATLGKNGAALIEKGNPGTLSASLKRELSLDTKQVSLSYLRRRGIPEILLYSLDPEMEISDGVRKVLRPISLAIHELLVAYTTGEWNRFQTFSSIPSTSSIHTLKLSESSYRKFFNKASEYLASFNEVTHSPGQKPAILLKEAIEPTPRSKITKKIASRQLASEKCAILSKNQSSLQPRDPAPVKHRKRVSPPQRSEFDAIMKRFIDLIESAQTSTDLLDSLLGELVTSKLFDKSALIVAGQDKKEAVVVAARGKEAWCGQIVTITDPLSPLAEAYAQFQSFGKEPSPVSPFGNTNFAVAPLDAPHSTHVSLYADCGPNRSVTFGARKVFRAVVTLLNEKLPHLPGYIPVELE